MRESGVHHGGCGSSSLHECIELLNNTIRNAPASLHSGIEHDKLLGPQQVMSPNVEESPTTTSVQPSGSAAFDTSLVKDEPQTQVNQVKTEVATTEVKPSTLDVKEELSEPEVKEENCVDPTREEAQESKENAPLTDSEDSLDPERVAEELSRLSGTQVPMVSVSTHPESEEGASAPNSTRNWEGAAAPNSIRDRDHGPYAPQRAGRYLGRLRSPDPFMFNTTIWINHDQEASARMHEDPVEQLRDRVFCMKQNLETLRTRLTHVADLRDAQGIREDHHALVARLNEVEECASVHTLREFMTKIHRLEAMLTGKHGGVIGEAIRVCNRRIDHQQAASNDVHVRIRTQDWHHELSDQEDEELQLSTRC